MAFPAADPVRMWKRVTVILCALGHLVVTLYVLHVGLGSSLDCFRGLNPSRSHLTKLQQANRKAAIEFRRQAEPLILMLRVQDIEAEVALSIQRQVGTSLDFGTVILFRYITVVVVCLVRVFN